MSGHRPMFPPSQSELDAAWSRFDVDWGGVDEVLYRLCSEHPGHENRRIVTAKLALVGRVYAAGLERRVTPPPGEQAIAIIANHVRSHGPQVDGVIRTLSSVQEPLDARAMESIVEQHGRLTGLLQKVTTDGKAPRSFASKYLHFHHPVVPIYDEYVRQTITRLVRWDASLALFPLPPHGDPEYWNYCVRFLRLYAACQEAGTTATVKSLDAFLWAVPVPRMNARS